MTKRIHVLEPQVAELIAAGEVVERPAAIRSATWGSNTWISGIEHLQKFKAPLLRVVFGHNSQNSEYRSRDGAGPPPPLIP